MNWHTHPELLDRLAADYAVGTLQGGARRRFETVMRQHLAVEQAALRWQTLLAPMNETLPEMTPSPVAWEGVSQRLFGAATAAAAEPPAPAAVRVLRWWQRLLAPIPAGALAAGLAMGLVLPQVVDVWRSGAQDETQLPESYVGVLATAEGKPGLIVSSLRHGHKVDFKLLKAVPVPAGTELHLWTLDAQGVPQRVGTLPALQNLAPGTFAGITLPRTANEVFTRAVELAVSAEPAGTTPAAPSQPFVYRGLCGKLWRLPPVSASASVPVPVPAVPPAPPAPASGS
ncbi:MAG: hypothetical protein RIQ53_4624 [Pseudomonadota bacterium]|jgi:anti-sigma-K factor RskA